MAAPGGEQVYATLLLSDSYLPGALVLAHSLRDALATRKLAVLVTLDSVSADSITQLKSVYDHVIPVPRIRNDQPANLYLMNRADLHSAFTKINLWKQTQFSKIVYIDADVLAYRAPDELFDISHAFSAAPDIGWPDLFNTGVMVLTPNMGDYYAMMAMAERGISFDGADQGLINMHFRNNYNRLSFAYNVTPSAHYQYIPAYRHFQSSINMVHFIGATKPWFAGRDASYGPSPYDEMVGRWWAVYDRHYRVQESAVPGSNKPGNQYVQYFTKGEWRPSHVSTNIARVTKKTKVEHLATSQIHSFPISHTSPPISIPIKRLISIPINSIPINSIPISPISLFINNTLISPINTSISTPIITPTSILTKPLSTALAPAMISPDTTSHSPAEARSEDQVSAHNGGGAPPEQNPEPAPVPMNSWDAQRQPPPPDSRPEAMNFPSTHYSMSQDTTQFVPPERYPSPPKNMWYEVPNEPPASATESAPAIFPWEAHQPRPSRTFYSASPTVPPPKDSPTELSGERTAAIEPNTPTESSTLEHSEMTDPKSGPSTPITPTIKIIPSDPWTSFPRYNAWDEVPEISRYVDGLQQHRRTGSQGASRRGPGILDLGDDLESGVKSRGFRLTDFPSEVERPSLPVTPAPIHRTFSWGNDEEAGGEHDHQHALPAAEGVPEQSEWDPAAQLQKLAQQQSEALLRKLAGPGGKSGVSRDIPSRPLPFGSEPRGAPTYTAQQTSDVLSPQPLRIETRSIPEPSYSGPGAAWEKGEDVPIYGTPLPPTDKERDVLET
ncbi:nucleotide-diphospho-sugar transferase [Stachybotrys elegans]|uniref:glycogenin glucosyltransferase n=1 Tax=Stachybotrys elegans TaxID=80388 RepID=A0A8K0WLV9_9HYPO|nr:nucleotide-diphospho-sugar transferase [Stachybotrys elegans]